MKKYQKDNTAQGYQTWFKDNNDRLQATGKSGKDIFEKITGKLKPKLGKSLIREQGFICAYCGKRIGDVISKSNGKEVINFAIDHFEPKSCNRSLALDYNNLIGTCKMSEHNSQRVDLKTIKSRPITFSNIAKELGIDANDFTGKGKLKDDDDLDALSISEIKYRDIPTHCDDNKEIGLEKIGWRCSDNLDDFIINPSKIENCDLFFTYDYNGAIGVNSETSKQNQIKVRNSISVFNLENKYLKKARVDAYKKGENLLNEFIRQATLIGKEFSPDDIEQAVIDEIYNVDDEGKLEPYCFVTAYVLRQYLD